MRNPILDAVRFLPLFAEMHEYVDPPAVWSSAANSNVPMHSGPKQGEIVQMPAGKRKEKRLNAKTQGGGFSGDGGRLSGALPTTKHSD
jgi:hypothetical protein